MEKGGYLLVSAGQNNSTARLTAVANTEKFVGNGWMPLTGLTQKQAFATAVYLNSTLGRLQLMRNPARTLTFPSYGTDEVSNIRVPDLKNIKICNILAKCWKQTSNIKVPQYHEGECEVRRIWDEAVALAMGLDSLKLAELRFLLHNEPHVKGLGLNQFGDT